MLKLEEKQHMMFQNIHPELIEYMEEGTINET